MFRNSLLAAAAAVLAVSSTANASLIFDSEATMSGTGLGGVATILAIQATGQRMGGSETGSVSWNGSADMRSGVDVKTGASQTLTRTVGSLGITDATQFRIVFNADQPDGSGITLNNLQLTVDAANGSVVFNSGAFSASSFSSTQNG